MIKDKIRNFIINCINDAVGERLNFLEIKSNDIVKRVEDSTNLLQKRCDELEHKYFQTKGMLEGLSLQIEEGRDETLKNIYFTNINFLSRRKTIKDIVKDGQKVKVMFLVHNVSAFETIEPLILQMSGLSGVFDIFICSIPHRFPGDRTFSDEDVWKFLNNWYNNIVSRRNSDFYATLVRLNSESELDNLTYLRKADPDIIFRQSQWDDDIHKSFGSINLAFTRTCMIPYGGVLLIEPSSKHIDNELFLRNVWCYFVPNEDVKKGISHKIKPDTSLNTPNLRHNVVVSGHPKILNLLKQDTYWPISGQSGGSKNRLKVLWSVHHSINDMWLKFGTFDYVHQELYKFALQNSDIDIVLSIHPTLFTIVNEPISKMNKEQLDSFLTNWNALPNTSVTSNIPYGGLFKASDVLVADSVSWLAEYQAFKKPLIFLERLDHDPFNEIGQKAMTGLERVSDVKEVFNRLLSFAKDRESLIDESRAERQNVNADYFFGANKGETAVDTIISSILNDCENI